MSLDDFRAILIAVAATLVSTVLVLLVGRLKAFFQRRWKRDAAPQRASDGELARRRPHRHPHSYPLFQPVFASSEEQGQVLIDLVRQSGSVPIEEVPHPSRVRSAGRWIKRNFLTFDTDPKPAFAVTSWHFHRQCDLGSADFFEHSIGFVLSFELEEGESRPHLLRSLKSGKRCDERLVAIASVEALADPNAWVRCLVVNAHNTDEPPDRRSQVAVQATRAAGLPHGSVFRARQKDVRDDALWLFCRAPALAPPKPSWGQSSEQFVPDPADFPPPSEHHRQHINQARQKNNQRQRKAWLAIALGPPLVLSLFLLLAAAMAWHFHWWLSSSFDLDLGWLSKVMRFLLSAPASVSAFWLATVAIGAVEWFLRWSGHRRKRSKWPRQDSPDEPSQQEQASPDKKPHWSAGTSDSLLLGRLYLGGPAFDPNQWQQYRHHPRSLH